MTATLTQMDVPVNGRSKAASGTLTLQGLTKPVNLILDSFEYVQNMILKRKMCGAETIGKFDNTLGRALRDQFAHEAREANRGHQAIACH